MSKINITFAIETKTKIYKVMMKQRKLLKLTAWRLMGMSLAFSSLSAAAATEITDRVVRLESSVQSTSNPVSLINDGNENYSASYWSTNNGSGVYGQYEYVELQWEFDAKISSVQAHWAPNRGKVAFPTEAYVCYWDGTQWVKAADFADLSKRSSDVSVDVKTKKIRIYVMSDKICGIREVNVYGEIVHNPDVAYKWPEYSPTLDYDYRSEYPTLSPPTKFLPENNNQKGYMADGWWAIAWGPNTSHYVTDIAKKNILAKMNEDFAYFRDVMGWPPDKRARNGYYSTVYVYGSGLYSDTADSTARGGWQGATYYNGSNWPMVNISYYPIACFDPSFTYDKYYASSVTDQVGQQNACVHEGIHAIFADLEGCKNSAWYHEAGNTWLQAEAEVKKTGITPTSMGYLSAGNMIAPFMPIECYSGWLLDDTFGGPAAEGVNMYNSSGAQVCTWRNMLGGVQYGELFPHFVAEILGKGSIPWIWRNCKSRVLEGMADSLGDRQMRRLIMEYRARQAMIDVGVWSTACRKLLNDNWLLSVKQEWSPYWKSVKEWQATPYSNMYKCTDADSTGWYYPEYRTTPGWSGANQIPLHVSGVKGDTVSIYFKPLGTNMTCQLCYRSKRGKIYYSEPVEGEGEVAVKLQEVPANKVVMAVITNTDYIYEGEETRKRHFDYRLKMGQNVYQPAKAQIKWYMHNQTLKDPTFSETTDVETAVADEATSFKLEVGKTVVKAGGIIPVSLKAAGLYQVPVVMFSSNGTAVYSQSFRHDGDYQVPTGLASGIYVLKASNGHATSSVKIVVK